jgi:hypothetical protein
MDTKLSPISLSPTGFNPTGSEKKVHDHSPAGLRTGLLEKVYNHSPAGLRTGLLESLKALKTNQVQIMNPSHTVTCLRAF